MPVLLGALHRMRHLRRARMGGGMTALAIPDAASELGVSTCTLRRWIAAGCPVARRGGRGRGRLTMVDPERVRAWRAGDNLARPPTDFSGIVADRALATVAEFSAQTRTGAEARILRAAVGHFARHLELALREN